MYKAAGLVVLHSASVKCFSLQHSCEPGSALSTRLLYRTLEQQEQTEQLT